jgi:hypothetical protein
LEVKCNDELVLYCCLWLVRHIRSTYRLELLRRLEKDVGPLRVRTFKGKIALAIRAFGPEIPLLLARMGVRWPFYVSSARAIRLAESGDLRGAELPNWHAVFSSG